MESTNFNKPFSLVAPVTFDWSCNLNQKNNLIQNLGFNVYHFNKIYSSNLQRE